MTPDLPVVHPWFGAEDAGDGVTRLIETHVDPFLESNVWHVRGSERDLVVDAANGIGPLRPAIDALSDGRPVVAVVTHAHFDHVGGLHEFEDRRCHRADAEMPSPAGLRLMREDFPAWLVEDFEYYDSPIPEMVAVSGVPDRDFDPAGWTTPSATATDFLDEGDVVDLGDRAFTVLHTPGHTAGSICLWDEANGALFSGDAIYVDARLGWEDPVGFGASLERLRDLDVRVVHAGHGRSFDGAELRHDGRRRDPRPQLSSSSVRGLLVGHRRCLATLPEPPCAVERQQGAEGQHRPDPQDGRAEGMEPNVADEEGRREDEEDGAGDERQRVETVGLHEAPVIRSILTSPTDACTDSSIGRSALVPSIVSSIVRSTPPRERSPR